jgi:hypothetical protein
LASSSKPQRIVAARDERLEARVTAATPLPGVRAGSALVRVGARLLAIQDDAFAAVWIDPRTHRTEPLVLRGAGGALEKKLKPDFEAAFVHDGRIWVLGSGSRPNRCCIARVDVAQREVPLFNALPLYGAIARALGQPANIEGAVPLPDRLRLFHRGPGRSRDANYTLDVPLDILAGAPPQLLDVRRFDLGAVGGLFLGFTDAVPLDAGRLLYLAVAEDTPDGILDGPIAGAAVGVLDGATARWNTLLEADGAVSRRKVEGVALDPGGQSGWLLTDPDDPDLPAELCRLELGTL